MSTSRLTIAVSGMIAADPYQGGATWAVLQYVLGLRALGHRVLFVEPIAAEKILPAGAALDDSLNARYFRKVVSDFELDEAAILLAGTQSSAGMSPSRLAAALREADVLINISGMLTEEASLEIPTRVCLDLDPAFNQLWQAGGIDM